ncbi:hypothetical protein L6452_03802 [Arctium lappa]|uniref:Uncharacterized protein n=1 Tax=Arctium lappa TaxID=4217 RepID=A0ACB9FNE2_ARCLA|nr:hypothetical protein L6452_03802 [Arctium lappa]
MFRLGHDSLMWASFNTRGKALFLEEDLTGVQTVLKDAPDLNDAIVKYQMKLSEVDELKNTLVEKVYVNKFLCEKYRKHVVGRLWHFEIPPTRNVIGDGRWFC